MELCVKAGCFVLCRRALNVMEVMRGKRKDKWTERPKTSVWTDFRLDSKPGLVEQISKHLAMAVDSWQEDNLKFRHYTFDLFLTYWICRIALEKRTFDAVFLSCWHAVVSLCVSLRSDLCHFCLMGWYTKFCQFVCVTRVGVVWVGGGLSTCTPVSWLHTHTSTDNAILLIYA